MAIVLSSRAIKSEPKALRFEDVARAELPVLYRMATRLARNPDDAEDLVSQTLLLAHRAWANFDGSYARSWLLKILKNEFYATRRRKGAGTNVSIDDVEEPSDEGFWKEISWAAVGERVMQELDALPEEYRLAVALCDVEEMSYEEVAKALEVPVGTVRSRLFRGRRLLRAKLVHLVD
jgi:RNA polymerase sigma-70 factor (ECF subfamily)